MRRRASANILSILYVRFRKLVRLVTLDFRCLLSILYVRFRRICRCRHVWLRLRFQFSMWDSTSRTPWSGACWTFNSLCEIPLRGMAWQLYHILSFQFSMWDSVLTQRREGGWREPFNSLCEILCAPRRFYQRSLWDLSILYVRFRVRLGRRTSGYTLSILYVRFLGCGRKHIPVAHV